MTAWLSRYRPRYLSALVYMLQRSEYHPREYLRWLHRTGDFSRVQRRQRLKFTAKARLLYFGLWLVVIVAVAVAAALAARGQWVWAAAVVLLGPWALPYVVLVPLAIGSVVIQRPQERRMNIRTTGRLANTTAAKIAIAGSYGKTTMKELLATVLGGAKTVAATPGNYNTPIGIGRFVSTLSGQEEVLIFELGEYYPGDVAELARIVQPDMGVITGVNEAHLDKFKTLERTAATIFELADYLGTKPVYVNGESPLAAARADRNQRLYGIDGVDGWQVDRKSLKADLNGVRFTIHKGKTVIRASSQLLGRHQVGPLAAVIAIADHLGLSAKQIETGIAKTRPFEHRMELKPQAGNITLIDDTYNGNPDGAQAAIEFLHSLRGRRRVYATPGFVEMGSRTAEVHRQLGRALAGAVEVVLLMHNSVAGYIEEGLRAGGFTGEVRYFPTSLEAVRAVPMLTKAGDVVLLQNDWGDSYG